MLRLSGSAVRPQKSDLHHIPWLVAAPRGAYALEFIEASWEPRFGCRFPAPIWLRLRSPCWLGRITMLHAEFSFAAQNVAISRSAKKATTCGASVEASKMLFQSGVRTFDGFTERNSMNSQLCCELNKVHHRSDAEIPFNLESVRSYSRWYQPVRFLAPFLSQDVADIYETRQCTVRETAEVFPRIARRTH